MAVSIDPLKTCTSDEVNPTFASLTVSGPVTLSGGTANGVAYLNGSNVLTTQAALTFDGTTLAVTGSISATGTATLSDAVYFQKELALLNTMAEPATIANRSQIYVDEEDGLLKLKDGAGVVKVFDLT